MYFPAPSLFTRAVIVRRHVLFLVPAVTGDAAMFGVLLAGSLLTRSLMLVGGGLLLTTLLVSYQYMQWRAFHILVYADRIIVFRIVYGMPHQRVHAFARLNHIDMYPNPLMYALDVGTLVLHTDDQSFTYSLLTPYTSLERAFGQ